MYWQKHHCMTEFYNKWHGTLVPDTKKRCAVPHSSVRRHVTHWTHAAKKLHNGRLPSGRQFVVYMLVYVFRGSINYCEPSTHSLQFDDYVFLPAPCIFQLWLAEIDLHTVLKKYGRRNYHRSQLC